VKWYNREVRRQIWPRQRKRTLLVRLRNVVSVTGSLSALTSKLVQEIMVTRRSKIVRRHVEEELYSNEY
jgi:hypothetical protein